MNLAPSLDVNNNPDNPVIGVRSYSDNPKTVSEYGNKYIKGLQ
jgi:beta-N-acetylhexosaminidase